jgi:S-disulfanyl-L-cysteine oxidoreductase SoxD
MSRLWFAAAAAFLLAGPAGFAASSADLGLGRPATSADVAAWNIDVEPDGKDLPPGSGTPAEGARIFTAACAICHGDPGQGGTAPRLVGGIGTLATTDPIKTVGSYWPYATTVFDYIRRAMPFTAPQSLTNDQVYAVVAYILDRNGIVGDNGVMNATSLPAVQMPNRSGFLWVDPRPDVHASACLTGCP